MNELFAGIKTFGKEFFELPESRRMAHLSNPCIVDVSSISEFMSVVQLLNAFENPHWIFRGESRLYQTPISSSLFREWEIMKKRRLEILKEFDDITSYEEYLIDKFLKLGHYYIDEEDDIGRLGVMSLAQHYGLQTRLIDWTHNGLIALYFAVEVDYEHEREKDGYIYCLQTKAIKEYKRIEDHAKLYKSRTGTIKSHEVIAYNPVIKESRIRVQEATFTWQTDPTAKILEELLDDIRIVRIEGKHKMYILNMLYKIGVRQSKLFPDLGGIATDIKIELDNFINRDKASQAAMMEYYLDEGEGIN